MRSWAEKTKLAKTYNVRTDRGKIESRDNVNGWSIKTPVAGLTVGTIFQLRNGAVDTAGTGWVNATGTLSGGASDVVSHVAIFDRTLTAAEIAGITRTLTPAAKPEIPLGTRAVQVLGCGYEDCDGIYIEDVEDPVQPFKKDATHYLMPGFGALTDWCIVGPIPKQGGDDSLYPYDTEEPLYTGPSAFGESNPWDPATWVSAYTGEETPYSPPWPDGRPAPHTVRLIYV